MWESLCQGICRRLGPPRGHKLSEAFAKDDSPPRCFAPLALRHLTSFDLIAFD